MPKKVFELVSEVGMLGSKPNKTPNLNFELNNDDALIDDLSLYRRLISKLLHLTITHLDISYSVQCLSQFMQSPKQSHLDAVYRVLRYVKQQPVLGILLS